MAFVFALYVFAALSHTSSSERPSGRRGVEQRVLAQSSLLAAQLVQNKDDQANLSNFADKRSINIKPAAASGNAFQWQPFTAHLEVHAESAVRWHQCPYTKKPGRRLTISEINANVVLILTQLFPVASKPTAYAETRPRACNAMINCNNVRYGLGRNGGFGLWAFAVVIPVAVALAIMHSLSLKPRTCGALGVNTGKAFVALLSSTFFAFLYGVYSYNPSAHTVVEWCILATALCGLTCSSICTLWFIDIEFGRLELSATPYLQAVGILYFIFILAGSIWVNHYWPANPTHYWSWHVWGGVSKVYPFVATCFLPRNFGLVLWICWQVKGYLQTFYFWDDSTGSALSPIFCYLCPDRAVDLAFELLIMYAPYVRDRRFIMAFAGYLVFPRALGRVFHCWSGPLHVFRDDIDNVLLQGFFYCACCVTMRYQVALPDQLQKIRYIRLGYIREMLRDGRKITRCQELPESSWGNPAKVTHLVIISHHWLDGHTCDMPTPECPQGLRLTTMGQRLESHFPTLFPGFSEFCANPINTIIKAVTSATLSSHDVLVFFDFASLPQIGMAPDGSLIDRTPEEAALFKQVLPACGLLYTMFPVMVCPEVCEGVTPYSSSGWCFCEWEQAHLCGTLSPYSTELYNSDDAKFVQDLGSIEYELKEKLFRCEEDRDIVRGIVKGTWIRHELKAAVSDGDAAKVQAYLKQLTDHNLQDTISFPVDSQTLDTLLHCACKSSSKEVESMLIEYGADPDRPNHRGERPGQFLLFPVGMFQCFR